MKQLGFNPAGLNGFALEPNKPYTALHGDIVEVLHGKYLYEVSFEPKEATPAAAPKKPSTAAAAADANRPKRTRAETANTSMEVIAVASTSDSTLKRTRTSSAAAPTTAAASVAPAADVDRWESLDAGRLLIFTAKGVKASDRIAGYDIDGTIIKTRSGNVFPKNPEDWQIAFAEVPGKLREHLRNGYKLVFFTNQAGMSSGRTDKRAWQTKLERIVQQLNVPVQVFVATSSSIYRKPKTGMWDTLKAGHNDGVRIDRQRSWFVGDAAGRAALGKRRKDHSLADRLFGANIDVPFQTPEEHFQGVPTERYTPPEFDPVQAMRSRSVAMFEPRTAADVRPEDGQQVIVMVGAPGSGKSHVARTVLEPRGFVVINQDKLKTWQKCVAMLESTLRLKQSAVVDNTNMDVESRMRYIKVARQLGVKCRCYMMCTSLAQSRHNIAFRELTDPTHSTIPDRLLIGMR